MWLVLGWCSAVLGGEDCAVRAAVVEPEGSGMWRLVALVMLPAAARAQSMVPVGCAHWFDGACLPR